MELIYSFPRQFYDNSILPGTKIGILVYPGAFWFYDNSILPGTKICNVYTDPKGSFTITQFFQVLKSQQQ